LLDEYSNNLADSLMEIDMTISSTFTSKAFKIGRTILPLPIKIFASRNLRRFISVGTLPIRSVDGRVFMDIKDRVFLGVKLSGEYEPELTAIVAGLVQQGDTCVDVGANFGWYATLLGRLVHPSGKVLAVEPSARVASVLKANVSLNSLDEIVEVTVAAAGDSAGSIRLSTESDTESALAYVTPDGHGDVVPMVTIDSLASGIEPSLVKIDVEGYEAHVLVGMAKMLGGPNPPMILVELNAEALERAGSTRESVLRLLGSYNYRLFNTDRLGLHETSTPTTPYAFAVPDRGRFARV
jgi:FkbM family methyltransferase